MNGMIKAVLFDMDGILFDSEYWYMKGTVEQMRAFGYQGDEKEIYRIIGTTIEGTYRILYELLEGRVSLAQLEESNTRYFREHPIDFKAIMFEDVPAALKRIRAMGIQTAVCSSSPYDYIENGLKDMGIRDMFDYLISGADLEHPKPAPDGYLLARQALGTAPENCIIYEDSTLGIESGKRAGIFTVARRDERFHQDQSQADLIVQNITELADWIGKENSHA